MRPIWFIVTMMATVLTPTCKKSESKLTSKSTDTITLAIATPIHHDVENFYYTLQGRAEVPLRVLPIINQLLPIDETSEPIEIVYKAPYAGKPGQSTQRRTATFMGLRLGTNTLIFKKKEKSWGFFDTLPNTYLESQPIADRLRYFIEATYFERDRIKRLDALINSVEFVARFIPGYAGAERASNATTTSGRILGVVQAVGDVSTLAIGTPIKIVNKAATYTTITAASIRVAHSMNEAGNGRLKSETAIDGVLAVVEAGLAFVSYVKLDLSLNGATVRNLAEAQALSPRLTRSPEDILKNGLTKAELDILGIVPNPKLGHTGAAKSTTVLSKLANGNISKIDISKLIPNLKEEVAIGFEGAHVFIQVGMRRFDSAPIQAFTARIKDNSDSVMRSGALVHLKGLDADTKKKLFDAFSGSGRNLTPDITCATGACKILSRSAGIVVGKGGLIENSMPSALLKNILSGQIYNHGGKTIDFDLFLTTPVQLSNYIDSMGRVENTLGTAFGGFLGSLFILQFSDGGREAGVILVDSK